MYSNNRDAYRQAFFTTWQKYKKQMPLEPFEAQLVEVMISHPEYHALLERPDQFQQQEFAIEENPFMHMSLHLAIKEQITTDRPAGVRACYEALLVKHPGHLEAEHLMLDCLAQMMWSAQETGEPPSEADYLEKLKHL